MKPEIRYRYETAKRTKEEALAERARRIKEAQDEIRHRMEQIQECCDFIKAEAERPLPTTYEKQVEVREGEPGFEELPPVFDPIRYQGSFQWQEAAEPWDVSRLKRAIETDNRDGLL